VEEKGLSGVANRGVEKSLPEDLVPLEILQEFPALCIAAADFESKREKGTFSARRIQPKDNTLSKQTNLKLK
jgi:hypothetical protein